MRWFCCEMLELSNPEHVVCFHRYHVLLICLAMSRNKHALGQLELELIQTQMTQKPMLRAEVYARALRASQNRKEDSV